MPITYNLRNLSDQTKLSPNALLKTIGVSIETLLSLNNVQLSTPDPDWENMNFETLQSSYGVTTQQLTIPETLVNPHRAKLHPQTRTVDMKDILSTAMWCTLTRLRHKYEPHNDSLEFIDKAQENFNTIGSKVGSKLEMIITLAYQDAMNELIEENQECGEAGIVKMTNAFSTQFASALSDALDKTIRPLLITVRQIQDTSRAQYLRQSVLPSAVANAESLPDHDSQPELNQPSTLRGPTL